MCFKPSTVTILRCSTCQLCLLQTWGATPLMGTTLAVGVPSLWAEMCRQASNRLTKWTVSYTHTQLGEQSWDCGCGERRWG